MIDWEKEWAERKEKSFWLRQLREKGGLEQYYGLIPRDMLDAHYKYVNYPGPIFEYIRSFIKREASVLDIGAGDGAFTIPSAQVARLVTAIEPLGTQISRLHLNAKREKLENIHVINKTWEDISDDELCRHDVVIAAHCFSMIDISLALQKMINYTNNILFLILSAGSGLTDIYNQTIYDNNTAMEDYIYIYNILYHMGVNANIQIINRRFIHPWGLMKTLLNISYKISADIEKKILDQLSKQGQLIREDNDIWVKSWHKDAIIWYNIE
jgi:hypothetical protein